ncbi:hypothetical protein JA1_001086 [Spathaspora sp. JA1]|nr:hypothetical protein JA1_001086 [Spathaspora sp. JA1]
MPAVTFDPRFTDSIESALKKQKVDQYSSIPTSTEDFSAHKHHHHKHHHHHHKHHKHQQDIMTQEKPKQEEHHHHHHKHQHPHTTDAIVDATHGTFTPISNAQSVDTIMSDVEELSRQVSPGDLELITEKHFILQPDIYECPCGHLHGPGQDAHHDHDIHAVGLSDHPLLQGPE